MSLAISGWVYSMNSLMLTSGNWALPPINFSQQAQFLGWRQQAPFGRHMRYPNGNQTSAYCIPCPTMWLSVHDTTYTSAPKTSCMDPGLQRIFTALETMVKFTIPHTLHKYYICFKPNFKNTQMSKDRKCHTWDICPALTWEVNGLLLFTFFFLKKLL